MHVGEVVGTRGFSDLGPHRDEGPRRFPEIERVDHDQHVVAVVQLLNELDASDSDVENTDVCGHPFAQQADGHGDSETVVAAQKIADTGHEHAHVEQDMAMNVVAELEERLQRYPADRYPVQRATALFHLGVLLTAEKPARASDLLAECATLFEQAALTVEEGKARNALGAALRESGDLVAAATQFRRAADALGDDGIEGAAALFNLALVTRDRSTLEQARQIFSARGARREEAWATRELGALELEQGDMQTAVVTLERALALADVIGDNAAVGATANALGLAYLATGRTADAVDALRRAAGAHPRSIRPQEHAMVKGNLALAYEHAGEVRRARLAAKQALGVPAAPTTVEAQALATLGRLGGPGTGDLAAALAEEPTDEWPHLVREEIARWADAEDATLRAEAGAWTRAQDLARAEALLNVLFELPPEAMERVLAAILAVGSEHTRLELERAAALFHAPQEMRLRDTLARLEERRNSPAT